jgi:hypothetical protein
MYSENNFLLDCFDLTLYSNYSSFVKIYVKVMLQLQTSRLKYHFLGYSITCSYLHYHGTIYFFLFTTHGHLLFFSNKFSALVFTLSPCSLELINRTVGTSSQKLANE